MLLNLVEFLGFETKRKKIKGVFDSVIRKYIIVQKNEIEFLRNKKNIHQGYVLQLEDYEKQLVNLPNDYKVFSMLCGAVLIEMTKNEMRNLPCGTPFMNNFDDEVLRVKEYGYSFKLYQKQAKEILDSFII